MNKEWLKRFITGRLEQNLYVEIEEDYARNADFITKQECYDFATKHGARFLIDPVNKTLIFCKLKELP